MYLDMVYFYHETTKLRKPEIQHGSFRVLFFSCFRDKRLGWSL
ncbi:hypothetical protein D1AOALGA4SA_12463 [Olavius algarvensis Delta 1 endosymbiont]|nr:hypothetical protein D1AOALGA4SA_12463 [Olavius algarvensis Delta 1 endosymbiont]